MGRGERVGGGGEKGDGREGGGGNEEGEVERGGGVRTISGSSQQVQKKSIPDSIKAKYTPLKFKSG